MSSGMMVEHTPSYKVASILSHKENGICFVGYNDPDTPEVSCSQAKKLKASTFILAPMTI